MTVEGLVLGVPALGVDAAEDLGVGLGVVFGVAEPGFEGPVVALPGVFGWPGFGWLVGDKTDPGLEGVFTVEGDEEEEGVELELGVFVPALGAMGPAFDIGVIVFGGVATDADGSLGGDWGKVTRSCMQISIFECKR